MNETPSQTIGPFFSFGMDWMDNSDMAAPGSADALQVRGVLLDADGPVPDAVIELWQPPLFGRDLTGTDGSFCFTTVKPAAAPGGQAPHILVSVFARGLLQRLVTRIYFPDEVDANGSDPVLATVPEERRGTLTAEPDGDGLRFDIHLQGPRETVFFAY